MSTAFDSYHKWLGIPPKEQPPNHYRLLGIQLFEDDPEVIEAGANRQMTYLQDLSAGPELHQAQRLLNEISQARICLLDLTAKAKYDARLKDRHGALQAPAAPLPRGKSQDDRLPTASPTRRSPKAARSTRQESSETSEDTGARQPRRSKKSAPVIPVIALGVVTIGLIVGLVYVLRGSGEQGGEHTVADRHVGDDGGQVPTRPGDSPLIVDEANYQQQGKSDEDRDTDRGAADQSAGESPLKGPENPQQETGTEKPSDEEQIDGPSTLTTKSTDTEIHSKTDKSDLAPVGKNGAEARDSTPTDLRPPVGQAPVEAATGKEPELITKASNALQQRDIQSVIRYLEQYLADDPQAQYESTARTLLSQAKLSVSDNEAVKILRKELDKLPDEQVQSILKGEQFPEVVVQLPAIHPILKEVLGKTVFSQRNQMRALRERLGLIADAGAPPDRAAAKGPGGEARPAVAKQSPKDDEKEKRPEGPGDPRLSPKVFLRNKGLKKIEGGGWALELEDVIIKSLEKIDGLKQQLVKKKQECQAGMEAHRAANRKPRELANNSNYMEKVQAYFETYNAMVAAAVKAQKFSKEYDDYFRELKRNKKVQIALKKTKSKINKSPDFKKANKIRKTAQALLSNCTPALPFVENTYLVGGLLNKKFTVVFRYFPGSGGREKKFLFVPLDLAMKSLEMPNVAPSTPVDPRWAPPVFKTKISSLRFGLYELKEIDAHVWPEQNPHQDKWTRLMGSDALKGFQYGVVNGGFCLRPGTQPAAP